MLSYTAALQSWRGFPYAPYFHEIGHAMAAMQQADAWRRYEAGARSPFLYVRDCDPTSSQFSGWLGTLPARSKLAIIARREGADKSAAAPDWAVCEAPAVRPWQHGALSGLTS
ncbi:hypothetical protein CPLU01_09496 [Colletotrichum plurivorum]|uniref:Uncharacterized protein n=1 Tax=Colletotrichum plurivorum TaxID=2175906 RepID=A0A8H6K905_9PEZI|nr:hypothetical protein CPLU01_09496 [Colletotrichum plurivorum]